MFADSATSGNTTEAITKEFVSAIPGATILGAIAAN
jgi:hypothetical protein